jgi:hypothetical protein
MPVAKKFFRFLERTRDNVDGYEFSDATCCRRTCVQGRIDGTNVSANKHGNVTIEKVFLANKNDVGRLDHSVRRLNRTDQAKCFDHSKCFHEVRNLPESVYKSN